MSPRAILRLALVLALAAPSPAAAAVSGLPKGTRLGRLSAGVSPAALRGAGVLGPAGAAAPPAALVPPALADSLPPAGGAPSEAAPAALEAEILRTAAALARGPRGEEDEEDDSGEGASRRSGAAFDGSVARAAAFDAGGGAGRGWRGPAALVDAPSSSADDGGGPDVPGRTVRFHGQTFRSTLFRPNMPVEKELIRAIDLARHSIVMSYYEFKRQPKLLDALRRARRRGVSVQIIGDYSNSFPEMDRDPGNSHQPVRSPEIWTLLREGFDVSVLRGFGPYGINHLKLLVIDAVRDGKVDVRPGEAMAFAGSYNFNRTAEDDHYENGNFLVEPEEVATLLDVWRWQRRQALEARYASQGEDYEWPQAPPPLDVKVPRTLKFLTALLPRFVVSPNRAAGESFEDVMVEAYRALARSTTKDKTLDVSIFAFRSTRMAEAILEIARRGGTVRMVMDKGQSESDAFKAYARWFAWMGANDPQIKASGGSLRLRVRAGPDPDKPFQLAQKTHHKVSILARRLVQTGSANYTKYAAASNFEIAFFRDRKKDVDSYQFVFDHAWKVAAPFAAPEELPRLPADEELAAEAFSPYVPRPPPPEPPLPVPPAPRKMWFQGVAFPASLYRPFSPVAPWVKRALELARSSVRMALYELTLNEVVDGVRAARKALRKAKKDGTALRIIIHTGHVYTTGRNSRGELRMPSHQILSLIREFPDQVRTISGLRGGLNHHKIIVVDAEEPRGLLFSGSHNLTRTSEEEHFEHAHFTNERERVREFADEFDKLWDLAKPIDEERLRKVLEREEPADAGAPREDDEEDAAPAARAQSAGEGDGADEEDDVGLGEGPIVLNGTARFKNEYFSPNGGGLDALRRAVRFAQQTVLVDMFRLDSVGLARDVVKAAKRLGKDNVVVMLDKSQAWAAKIEGVPAARWFAEKGVQVVLNPGPNRRGDPMLQKKHGKAIIVDGKLAVAGSMNGTNAGETKNRDNLSVYDHPTDVAGFLWFFLQELRSVRPSAELPQPLPPDA